MLPCPIATRNLGACFGGLGEWVVKRAALPPLFCWVGGEIGLLLGRRGARGGGEVGLFYRDGFGEVAGLVYVAFKFRGNVVGEELLGRGELRRAGEELEGRARSWGGVSFGRRARSWGGWGFGGRAKSWRGSLSWRGRGARRGGLSWRGRARSWRGGWGWRGGARSWRGSLSWRGHGARGGGLSWRGRGGSWRGGVSFGGRARSCWGSLSWRGHGARRGGWGWRGRGARGGGEVGLFYRDGFGEVAGLVYVAFKFRGNVVGEELEGEVGEDGEGAGVSGGEGEAVGS